MAKKPAITMTLTDFAKKWGVDYSTAKRWRKDGLVVPSHGPVDVLKSEARLAERPSYNRGGNAKGPTAETTTAPTSGPSLADAKRVRATFEALLAEARHERLVGSLAPVDAAIAYVAEELTAVKERFREVPPWVASRLVDANTAPRAAAILSKTFAGALHDLSKEDHEPAWDGCVDEKLIPADESKVSHVDCWGEIHCVRVPKEETPPPAEEPKKPKRRRSIAPIESAIAESGAADEVDNELVVAVERAVPTMTLTEARTRREVAEGGLKRAQFEELKRRVVRIDKVKAALTANHNVIRTNVLSIASKAAPRVALLTDAKAIERVISKELESVLADMAEPKTLIEGALHYED